MCLTEPHIDHKAGGGSAVTSLPRCPPRRDVCGCWWPRGRFIVCTHQPAQANISPFSTVFDVGSAFRCPCSSDGFTPRAEGKSWAFCSHPRDTQWRSWHATAWRGGSAVSTAGSHISILKMLKAWCLSYRHVCAWNKGAASHPQPALQTKLPLAQIQLLPVQSEELAGVLGACELHACFVRRLFNHSLILALG